MIDTDLVKVGLQPMNFRLFLQQSRPVLFLQLLFSKHHLDVTVGMVDLGLFWIKLIKEIYVDGISDTLGCRLSREGQLGWLNVQLEIGFGNIGSSDGEVDEISFGIGLGRALSPENYSTVWFSWLGLKPLTWAVILPSG